MLQPTVSYLKSPFGSSYTESQECFVEYLGVQST